MNWRERIAPIAGLGLNLLAWAHPRAAADRALRLFTRVPRMPIRDKENRFLATARTKGSHPAGHGIVEYHWGDNHRPYILLSYGWGYNAGRWRHFVPDLVAAGFRVVAYDPPGHGRAAGNRMTLPDNAAIITELIRTYGQPAAFIGHSFGGASGVLALSDLPNELHPKRMVVMASFSDARAVFRQFRSILKLAYRTYYGFLHELERRTGRSVQEFDLTRYAARLGHVRALLIHDTEDPVTPYGQALRYHLFWPGSRLLSPTGKGHHLGSAEITRHVIAFAAHGLFPRQAEPAPRKLPADHDLVRFFSGLEA